MTLGRKHVQAIKFTQRLVEIRVRESSRKYLNESPVSPYLSDGSPSKQSRNQTAFSQVSIEERQTQNETAWKATEELLGELLNAVQGLETRREQSLLEMQHVAIELAVAAASHLVHTAIEQDQFGIEELLKKAVGQFRSGSTMQFNLNPEDLELLQRRLGLTSSYESLRSLNLRADQTIPRGTCEVTTSVGNSLLSNIATQLTQIRKHWLEELDVSQVERRQAQGTNTSLRRFPDRRETA